jgi:hypothetical protein
VRDVGPPLRFEAAVRAYGRYVSVPPSADDCIDATRRWLERAVVGLGLCPFAPAVHARDLIRYRVSEARTTDELLADLAEELQHLQSADPLLCETSLLIHPRVLADFDDYNQFLDSADDAVRALGLEGEVQVASFHPAYRFAGAGAEDIENYTNRSPYPMLHLLRESSVSRAIDASLLDVDTIGDHNKATLRRLGHSGWRALWEEAV